MSAARDAWYWEGLSNDDLHCFLCNKPRWNCKCAPHGERMAVNQTDVLEVLARHDSEAVAHVRAAIAILMGYSRLSNAHELLSVLWETSEPL